MNAKTTKIKMVLAIYLLLVVNCITAQTYAPVWSLPPYYENMHPPIPGLPAPQTMPWYPAQNIYDATGTPIGTLPNYAHNMIADGAGNNLIDIMDGNLFDSSGNYIDC